MTSMAGIPFNTSYHTAVPCSGDLRKHYQTGQMEIFNGSSWVAITDGYEQTESLANSVQQALDDIGSYVEEDCPDNPTVQDAYVAWREATERFLVILAMAEK